MNRRKARTRRGWTQEQLAGALLLHGRCLLRRAFSAPAVRVVVTRGLHRLHFVYTPVEGTSVEHVTCLKNTQLGIDPWKAG